MKRILFFFAVSISLTSYAQQFSFQMFFTDAIGNKDTLTLGYDTAATKLIDAAFGELNIIGVPLDSIFDVRVTDELWQVNGTFHTKKQITYYDCDSPFINRQNIDIKAKYWPVTATWNNTIFNDSCRDMSSFQSALGDIGGHSNLNWVRLSEKDSVTFTSNVSPWGGGGSYVYINNANDTIPVFFQTFIDSLHAFSIKELNKTKGIKVFPNPSTNSISLSVNQSFGVLIPICLYNIYGQLVLSTTQNENIDVTNLPKGLYLVKVSDKYGKVITTKFQKS
jgi:hypothetical protein